MSFIKGQTFLSSRGSPQGENHSVDNFLIGKNWKFWPNGRKCMPTSQKLSPKNSKVSSFCTKMSNFEPKFLIFGSKFHISNIKFFFSNVWFFLELFLSSPKVYTNRGKEKVLFKRNRQFVITYSSNLPSLQKNFQVLKVVVRPN